MANVRLMSRPEDFEKIGIKPRIVEPWEDGRRDDDRPGVNEVWYFDATMEDGTKVVVGFRPKAPDDTQIEKSSPNLNILVTTPDGVPHADMWVYSGEEGTMSKEKCEVHYGPHSAVGNLEEYDVKVVPEHGVGADLHYKALVKPFRPGGTAYVALGDNDEMYYTDMSIPKSIVTGTVTVDGRTYEVTGTGYHDHQWMNINPYMAWHHWVWGRLYAGEYTVVIYDFTASERFGFKRVPILGILDGNGDVIFDNTQPVKCETELYWQEEMQKDFPKSIKYEFEDKGKKILFDLDWIDEIEVRNIYGNAPKEQKEAFDRMGLMPTYMRYYADGKLTIIDSEGTKDVSGKMIYEFAYFGKPDERAGI